MSFLRHKQIYQSDVLPSCQGRSRLRLRPWHHRLDESATAIPRRVALLQRSPPLHQPFVMVNRITGTVNHHLARAGEFSTGTLGNF
jgi:hypothetical protein